MTQRLLLHLALNTLLCLALSSNTAYSAFRVRQEENGVTNSNISLQHKGLTKFKQTITTFSTSKLRSLFSSSSGYPESKSNRGEVWGVLSIFSCLTIVLAPLGIIFGAIGIHKNRKNGAAIVGVILGILVTVGILILLSTWQMTLAMNMGPMNFGP